MITFKRPPALRDYLICSKIAKHVDVQH